MPINRNATIDIKAIERIHDAVTDFGRFLQSIVDNIDTDATPVKDIPGRVTQLLASKSRFDSLGISASRIEEIMIKNVGYTDWSVHATDFQAVFNEAPALRTSVINNINMLDLSFSGDVPALTAPPSVQAAIRNLISGILEHYA